MSVAVKTRPIKSGNVVRYLFRFKKSTPNKIISEISNKYAPYLIEDDEELVDITTTDWYKEMDKKMKPKDYLRNLREVHSMTQHEIGEKIGTNAAHISDYETGQRAISKNIAKKLAAVFNTSPAVFI